MAKHKSFYGHTLMLDTPHPASLSFHSPQSNSVLCTNTKSVIKVSDIFTHSTRAYHMSLCFTI